LRLACKFETDAEAQEAPSFLCFLVAIALISESNDLGFETLCQCLQPFGDLVLSWRGPFVQRLADRVIWRVSLTVAA